MINLVPEFIIQQYSNGKTKGSFKGCVLFVDIKGFTTSTHSLLKYGKEGSEIITNLLNQLFSPAIDDVYKYEGFISTFAGDSFYALFNEEITHPRDVVQLASEIKNNYDNLNVSHEKCGDLNLKVRIYISYGNINWFVFEDKKQNTFAFLGNVFENLIDLPKGEDHAIYIHDSILTYINDTDKIRKGTNYHELISLNDISANNRQLVHYKNDSLLQSKFIPEALNKMQDLGEYREAISCFISIKNDENLERRILTILHYCHDYGGYFNKIEYGEKGLVALVLFGVPIAKEHIFTRATEFAVSLRNDICKINEEPFIRIGMTYSTLFAGMVGSLNRAEYTVIGLSANLAARYMMDSNWGDIWIDRFINDRIKHKMEVNYLGEKLFRGFDISIPYYQLNYHRLFVDFQTFEGNVIGRDKELKKLTSHIMNLKNKKFGGYYYIHGEAGIGKSRMIYAAYDRVGEENFTWCIMTCDEILSKSLNPIHDYLMKYFMQHTQNSYKVNLDNFNSRFNYIYYQVIDQILKVELAESRSTLAYFLGIYVDINQQTVINENYDNVLKAIKSLFKAISNINPLVLVFEDIHVIDKDTEKFIENFTSNIGDCPILLLFTARYAKDGSKQHLSFYHEHNVNEIELNTLDNKQVTAFIKDRLGLPTNVGIPQQTLRYILNITDGVPFFLEQILHFFVENNYLDNKLNIVIDKLDLPESITYILTVRIDRLEKELKEIIINASILGKEFATNILSAVMKVDNINNYLQRGREEGIWYPLSELVYIFKHALLRETIYSMQLKDKLKILHKGVAETIEDLFKDNLKPYYYDLAVHYEKAGIQDKTIRYLKNAISQSLYEGRANSKDLIDKLATFELSNLDLIVLYSYYLAYERSIGAKSLHYIDKIIALSKEIQLHKVTVVALLMRISSILNNFQEFEYKDDLELLQVLTEPEHMEYYYYKYLLLLVDIEASGASSVHKSEQILIKCEQYALENNLTYGLHKVYDRLSKLLMKADPYRAIDYINKVIYLENQLKNYKDIPMCYNDLASIYLSLSDYKKCWDYLQLGYSLCKKYNLRMTKTTILSSLTGYYISIHNYDKVLSTYKELIEIYKELNNRRFLFNTYINLCFIYNKTGNYKESVSIYNSLLDSRTRFGLDAIIHLNISEALLHLGQITLAIQHLTKGVKESQATNNKRNESLCYCNLGEAMYLLKKHKVARKYYKMAINIAEKINLKQYLGYFYYYIARAYFIENKFKVALDYADKAMIAAKNMDDIVNQNKVNLLLARFMKNEDAIKKLAEIAPYIKEDDDKADYVYTKFMVNPTLQTRREALRLLLEYTRKTGDYFYKIYIDEINSI